MRFYAAAARSTCSTRCPYAVAQYRSPRTARRSRPRWPTALRPRGLRFPRAGDESAQAACRAVGALHAQRRSRDLAAARGDRDAAGCKKPVPQPMASHAADSRHERCSRFDRVLAVSDVDRTRFRRSIAEVWRQPVSVIPTGVDTAYFATVQAERANAASPRVHRVDGLAAER